MPKNRPSSLDQYIGQQALKEKITLYTEKAKQDNEPLKHILLSGAAGTGKTTLAIIIANMMNAQAITINAANVKSKNDLIAIITTLKKGDILFIDEIHRLRISEQELLYKVMEEFKLSLMLDILNNKKLITYTIPRFTLIGATTKKGDLSKPLRDRFIINETISEYTQKEIYYLIKQAAHKQDFILDEPSIHAIANSSKETPRIAINTLNNIIALSQTQTLTTSDTLKAFKLLNINPDGLDQDDINYLKVLQRQNKPTGIITLSMYLNTDKKTITDTIEPYLIKNEYIEITTKGRNITKKGIAYIQAMKGN